MVGAGDGEGVARIGPGRGLEATGGRAGRRLLLRSARARRRVASAVLWSVSWRSQRCVQDRLIQWQ